MALIPGFFGGGGGGRRGGNIFDPFSLDIWDPFEGFGALANVPSSATRDASAALTNVRIDWRETPDKHVIKVDLPGVDRGDVKVEIEDGRVLQISGESRREQERDEDKWHRVERTVGRFVRRFRLPENARTDQVRATMENGVLTVEIPKVEERKSESRPVQITSGEGGRAEGGGGVSSGGEVLSSGTTGGGGGGGTTALSGGATGGGGGATGGLFDR